MWLSQRVACPLSVLKIRNNRGYEVLRGLHVFRVPSSLSVRVLLVRRWTLDLLVAQPLPIHVANPLPRLYA